MKETVKHAPEEWRYSINYGPEDEANYANVYDAEGHFVSNLKVHHAIAVVKAMNRAPDMLEALIMVRDADDDCKKDGLPSIPPLARAKIDAAIAKAEGRS